MSELRNFVADLLERKGAAVDAAVDPNGLEVLAPPSVQKATGWPELTRLGFGRERGRGTPVVFITARDDAANRAGLRTRMPVLKKPLDERDLLEAIDQVIASSLRAAKAGTQ